MTPYLYFGIHISLAFLLAPLFLGIINRVKAIVSGRHGKPLLQLYYDIYKLWRKSEVISTSSTWVFQAAPCIFLCTVCGVFLLLPFAGYASPLAFQGDCLLAAYLLAMGRFALSLAALDTASPFEGMGASREATFAALAEPVLMLCFLSLTISLPIPDRYIAEGATGFSLSSLFGYSPFVNSSDSVWSLTQPELCLVPLVLFIILLVENCRIPIDDPNTHLELTMIHEVIILDNSGPNLAYILYGVALKLWLFATLLVNIFMPPMNTAWYIPLWLGGIFCTAVLVGIVESVMARVRMRRIASLLGGAGVLAGVALILSLLR